MTWGMANEVVERFGKAGVAEDKITCEPDTFVFTLPAPPTELLGLFRDYYGPTMNAFEAAAANGRTDDLFAELDALFNEQNQSSDRERSEIPATFLRVTVDV
jgi:hypothetical protein